MAVVASMKPNQLGDSELNIPSCSALMKSMLWNHWPYIAVNTKCYAPCLENTYWMESTLVLDNLVEYTKAPLIIFGECPFKLSLHSGIE